MAQLDSLIVVIAAPVIRRDLKLDYSQMEWVIGSYVLLLASMMLFGGRLADRFGKRRVFLTGVALFSVASLTAGLAPGWDLLVTARMIQGAGAALTMPAALGILSLTFTDSRERGFAIGLWGAAIGAALAAGPPVGGLITQRWYWGGVFLVNVPLGGAALLAGIFVIPRSHDENRSRSLGLPGMCLSLTGLFGISYALISLNTQRWTSLPVIISFAGGIAAWLLFAAVDSRAADPLIHLEIFRDPVYSGGTVAIFFWSFSVSATSLFISVYLQDFLGLSPLAAGLAYLPMAVTTMAVAPVTGRLATKFGVAPVVTTGYILAAGGYTVLARLGTVGTLPGVVAAFSVIGIGTALTMPMQAAVIGAMPARWAGVAGGVLSSSRTIASLVGVAAGSAIIALRKGVASRQGATAVAAYMSGYRLGLTAAGILMLGGACIVVNTLRKRQLNISAARDQEDQVKLSRPKRRA